MSKILHITHPSYNVSAILTKSKLVDNITSDFLGDEYHTSLGDLSAEEIISIIPNFDSVNFIKDNFDISSDIYNETVLVLMYVGPKSHKRLASILLDRVHYDDAKSI